MIFSIAVSKSLIIGYDYVYTAKKNADGEAGFRAAKVFDQYTAKKNADGEAGFRAAKVFEQRAFSLH